MSRFDTLQLVSDREVVPNQWLRDHETRARLLRLRASMRYLTAGLALLIGAAACDDSTGPVVLQGEFSLVAFAGKQLPIADGDGLLIADSLSFEERTRDPSQPSIQEGTLRATVVHKRVDGSLETLRGNQSYLRSGDTVITSFACRFGQLCLALVAAPETGILRNDSLIFSPKSPNGPTRIYRRAH
jgi:hypothetical protein